MSHLHQSPTPPRCSREGCTRKLREEGLCTLHLYRERKKRGWKFQKKSTCTVEGCTSPYFATGWCKRHYSRAQKRKKAGHGIENLDAPLANFPRNPRPETCTREGCDLPYYNKGHCRLHFYRAKAGREMDGPPRPTYDNRPMTPAEQATFMALRKVAMAAARLIVKAWRAYEHREDVESEAMVILSRLVIRGVGLKDTGTVFLAVHRAMGHHVKKLKSPTGWPQHVGARQETLTLRQAELLGMSDRCAIAA
jgi:hypothetical protein